MTRLPLTLAINDYDHVRDLASGRVRPEGIDLTCLTLPVEEIFYRFTAFREWDVSELSLAKYTSLIGGGDSSLTAVPVFPSRVFRHSAIYVLEGGPVRRPADLRGARVGLPEWVVTAGVYARATLAHEYDVPLETIAWYQGGLEEPGREELVSPRLPPGISLTLVPDRTLVDMLLARDLDAIIAPRPPARFRDPSSRIVRLFPDFRAVEAASFRATGIFPIMHVVAIKRDVYDAHPWIAPNLVAAFEQAKRRSFDRLADVSASLLPIPWSFDTLPQAQALLGDDPWPYGVAANRVTLSAFLTFAFEQGVCARKLEPEELFPASVQRAHRV
jgi:4,5-dihydroxyphthalate decarboxylase